MHLIDVTIKRLPLPAKGSKKTYDDTGFGFGICVTAAGVKSFILRYRTGNGRERCFTIGRWPTWNATDARAEAQRLRRLIDAGDDPLGEVEAIRLAPTMNDLADRFEEEHFPRLRASTAADYKRMLRNHIRPHFGNHAKVSDVTFTDIDALHRKITKADRQERNQAGQGFA